MLICKVKELVKATRGTLLWGDPEQEVRSISTDSRNLDSGQVFWALKGPNFDGTAFAPQSLIRGASGIVVQKKPVLDAPPDKRPTRLLLCDLTADTIRHGLSQLLGIAVVGQM